MKTRIYRMGAAILVMAGLLAACGKTENKTKEGNVPLTSEWSLVEFTVNGNTTRADDLDEEVRKVAPGFLCEDGENCIISNGGKNHPGTITKEGDQYVIRFDDTEATMSAEISGDTLTMTNNKGSVTFVFRAD